ncbi:MAG: DUF485 domain-containing protein [Pseudomonadota bacterium]
MQQKSTSPGDLAATALVTVAFLGFLISVAMAPDVLARPVAAGQVVSWGIVAGLAMIALVVGVSLAWTLDRNRRDRALKVEQDQ